MEHHRYMHLPFARGRIEAGLPPAPLRQKRWFWKRWHEAISVLRGRSVAVLCHPHENETGSEGTLEKHKLIPRVEN